MVRGTYHSKRLQNKFDALSNGEVLDRVEMKHSRVLIAKRSDACDMKIALQIHERACGVREQWWIFGGSWLPKKRMTEVILFEDEIFGYGKLRRT